MLGANDVNRPSSLIARQASKYPFAASVLAHLMVYAAVALTALYEPSKPEPIDAVIEVGYEVLDEPPAPAEKERPLAKNPDPAESPVKVEDNVKPTMQELHDDEGEASGTQKDTPSNTAPNGSGDGDATSTPYYKIKPKYPREALLEGKEGWVLLQIDITEEGEVENVEVLDGENTKTFQYEARRAVGKWKYRPTLNAEGKAVRVNGHKVKVEFKLSEE